MRHPAMKVMAASIVAVFALAGASAREPEIRSGDDVLRAMHERYQGNWYDTLTFAQNTTTHNPDGTSKTEIWSEAAMLPGKLRIDFGKITEGNGAVFNDGTVTSFKDGKVVSARPFVHLLLVLGFDVYKQDAQITIDLVKGQAIDLSKVHEESWQGKTVYVIGAAKGDLKAKQFWVEKERLLFVRLLMPDEKDKTKMRDERFADYRQLSVGWIAARVEFYTDGKLVFEESYFDVVPNPKLQAAVFDPKNFNTEHWEQQ